VSWFTRLFTGGAAADPQPQTLADIARGMQHAVNSVDEMAEKLGIDPIEFRILNDTQVDPEKPDRPFSQRQLVECLQAGADRFGWKQRNSMPGKTREGRWLIGMGVAAAFRNNLLTKSAARVRLDNRGIVTVETDMTDIGTGSYTIIAQTAAEMMGLSLDKVVVRLGDSSFPVSCGSGGQWGGNSSTAGVYAACVKPASVQLTNEAFLHDAEQNCYWGPAGQKLKYSGTSLERKTPPQQDLYNRTEALRGFWCSLPCVCPEVTLPAKQRLKEQPRPDNR
jgi:CO/xanthine dehydrogenase Mo-binding subunit